MLQVTPTLIRLIPTNTTVILGLSGGPDSVFLLHQLILAQQTHHFTIVAAHLDHQWHPASKAAQEFCARLCQQLQSHIDYNNTLRSKSTLATSLPASLCELCRTGDFSSGLPGEALRHAMLLPGSTDSYAGHGRSKSEAKSGRARENTPYLGILSSHSAKSELNDISKDTSAKLIFISKTISELDFQPKLTGSREDLGRQYRRYFFTQLAQQYQPARIWLAHHADDQIETVLTRFIRGSSLTGLTGMQTEAGLYVRPLLHLTKATILEYLAHHQLTYFTDPTNSSPAYLRNRLRHTAIPALQACDNRFSANVQRSIAQLQASEQFLATHTQQVLQQLLCGTKLDLTGWRALDPYLQKRVLLQWLLQAGVKFTLTEKFLQELIRFLQHANTHSQHQIGNWSVIKRAGYAEVISQTTHPSHGECRTLRQAQDKLRS
ncbi:MAG TPA: tRNA lysidine(34) synthetase TilS [Candidatus Babeliales bacterium]|nr:tRNA lysidine(34) synthetase TilS [Candidatus Babeliales bacterium]